ncbi:hypothetical protein DBV39_05025 [Orrella marina]|uniref:Uncharacterized protein n=1 Tax=Orrella marina TaxID=2163011 RepID=A0A2R4XH77_9BURK|nr:hypothetical protein DBV39_05025 [Orrella marina]
MVQVAYQITRKSCAQGGQSRFKPLHWPLTTDPDACADKPGRQQDTGLAATGGALDKSLTGEGSQTLELCQPTSITLYRTIGEVSSVGLL